MAVLTTPGFDLIPSAEKQALSTNYISDFNFLNQYLPDTYEKEFERYGNRTISSFLRMVDNIVRVFCFLCVAFFRLSPLVYPTFYYFFSIKSYF